jgi:hypothetical protein
LTLFKASEYAKSGLPPLDTIAYILFESRIDIVVVDASIAAAAPVLALKYPIGKSLTFSVDILLSSFIIQLVMDANLVERKCMLNLLSTMPGNLPIIFGL